MKPKVSFVVPCYKLAHLLPECIHSILAQSFADFEILIMDENPLEDIRNTNTLTHVIKNGKVYDAETLNEVAPLEKAAAPFSWQTKKPEGVPGMKK